MSLDECQNCSHGVDYHILKDEQDEEFTQSTPKERKCKFITPERRCCDSLFILEWLKCSDQAAAMRKKDHAEEAQIKKRGGKRENGGRKKVIMFDKVR